jgi:ElaB/YqjD/DUF883 family membrane-anchored ribosome-binding protein
VHSAADQFEQVGRKMAEAARDTAEELRSLMPQRLLGRAAHRAHHDRAPFQQGAQVFAQKTPLQIDQRPRVAEAEHLLGRAQVGADHVLDHARHGLLQIAHPVAETRQRCKRAAIWRRDRPAACSRPIVLRSASENWS